MSVSVTKSGFNVREKLKQLQKPIGLKGSELMRAETAQDARDFVSAGRMNLLINGGFDVWQRGTTGSVVGGPAYASADRWRMYVNTSTTMTLSRQTFTAGQTEVPGNPSYYARFDWLGTGTSQFFGLDQFIEGCHHGSGDYLTVSFYARSQLGDDMYLGVNQNFGTGGSAQQNITNSLIELETYWKKFVYVLSVPSISGKTINKSDDNLSITFYRNGTQNSYLELSNVQVEVGKNATEFEHRSYGEELALCQRYFQKISNTGANTSRTLTIGGFNATRAFGGISLSTPMRTNTPAMTKGGNIFLESFGLGSTITVTDIGRYGDMNGSFIGVEVNAAAGIVGGTPYTLSFGGGTNAYITLDTEL